MKRYSINDIKKDKTFQKFLKKKRGLKESSINSYIQALQSFGSFTGKTPTELYDIHKKDLIDRTPEFDQWLNDALDEWVNDLIDKGYLYNGINLHLSRVKGFYQTFKLKPTPTIDIPKKKIFEDAKHSLKIEDIRKAIKHSKPVYQTIIITEAQTGLSIADILLLDVKDFVLAVSKKNEELTVKEAIYRAKNDNIIGCFDLRRKKSSKEFYTFAGPEVLRNISSLLENRSEQLLKPETPIFIKETSRLRKNKRKELKMEDLRLTTQAVIRYLERLHIVKKIFPMIEVDGKRRTYFRTHKLRKWFSNQLRYEVKFPIEDVKYLMGQKTGDVVEHYINPNNYNALKTNYRKALPYLAINDEIIMEENQEAIESLTNELHTYKEDSKAKDVKIADLERKQILMEDMVNSMIKKQNNQK